MTTTLGEAKFVFDPKDNTVYLDGFFKKENGQRRHFKEVAPMLFRSVDGPEKIALVKDKSGKRMVYIDYPFMLFQEVDGGLDRQIFNYVVIGFSVGVMVLTILLWPVAAILRKHYGKPLTLTLGDGARRWRRWVRVACFVDIAYLACLTLVLNALEKPGGLGSGSEWKLHLWQAIGVLGGIGALITIIAAIKSWGDEQQWVWYKIWNTLLAVGCVGFFWFLVHWHLLNRSSVRSAFRIDMDGLFERSRRVSLDGPEVMTVDPIDRTLRSGAVASISRARRVP